MTEHICVIGLGYIGLPTAIMFVKQGFQITGVDVNPDVISTLRSGSLHIHEDGLADAFNTALLTGRMSFSENPVPADVFIIAVPTPFNSNKTADLSYVVAAARSIQPVLKAGNMVVLESTSPPRTTMDTVLPVLEETGLVAGTDFDLVYSPERVLPGKILEELVGNDRIIGGQTQSAAIRAKELYGTFVLGEIHCTDPTTAEMVKLMENTYRDVNIALANEFSRIAVEQQIDVWEAVELANYHPRVNILKPGPGVGGHCISVDPWFLVEVSPESSDLIRTARYVNDSQPEFLLKTLKKLSGDLRGRKIAVLGLAYKPDIDDLRESPAIEFAKLLLLEGAEVHTFEPFSLEYQLAPSVSAAKNMEAAIDGAEVVAILVAHEVFRENDATSYLRMAKSVSREEFLILDAVNMLKPDDDKGIQVIRLGNGKSATQV